MKCSLSFLVIIFVLCVFVSSCSSSDGNMVKEEKPELIKTNEMEGHLFLNVEELEKCGFENFSSSGYRMLIEQAAIYILNNKDGLVAKFNKSNGIAERKYKASGQGPGEFLSPASLFRHDASTIGILDASKLRILFFDNDLNLKKEFPVPSNLRKIMKDGETIYAFGDFFDHYLAILSPEYTVKETFMPIPKNAPFERVYPGTLYMGHLMPGKEIAATSWGYYNKECIANIVDVDTKETKVVLKWTHPDPPNQADVNAQRKLYGSDYINKHGNYFVVQNSFNITLDSPTRYELFVFSGEGKLLSSREIPFSLIRTNEIGVNKMYYMDNDGNIMYWDLETSPKWVSIGVRPEWHHHKYRTEF